MNQLETLLQRYKEGVITPGEQAELDRMTNRQEVFNAASAQASAMRRRRYAVVSSLATLLIVAGIAYTAWNSNGTDMSDSPMVAQYSAEKTPVAVDSFVRQDAVQQANARPQQSSSPDISVATKSEPQASNPGIATKTPRVHTSVVTVENNVTEPSAIPITETVVACNTQCSPDSVINDIWNFLKA